MKLLSRWLFVGLLVAGVAGQSSTVEAGWGSSGGSTGYGSSGGSSGYVPGGSSGYGSGGSSGYQHPGILQHLVQKVKRHLHAKKASFGSSGGSSGYVGGSSGYTGGSSGYTGGSSGSTVRVVRRVRRVRTGGSSGTTSYGSSGTTSVYRPSYTVPSYGSTGSSYGSTGSSMLYHGVSSNSVDSTRYTSARSAADDEIHLSVGLPEDAIVYVNGNRTSSLGEIRHFVSRGVEAGSEYRFDVRAEVERNGQKIEEQQVVVLTAGQSKEITFPMVDPQEKVITSLTLDVPEGAKVILAGNETTTTGTSRTYRTKQLAQGETWDDYTIRVEFEGETKEQTIRVIGGDELALAFSFDTNSIDANSVAVN